MSSCRGRWCIPIVSSIAPSTGVSVYDITSSGPCLSSLKTMAPAWPVDLPDLSSPLSSSTTHPGLSDQKRMQFLLPTYPSIVLPFLARLVPAPFLSYRHKGAVKLPFIHSLSSLSVLIYLKGFFQISGHLISNLYPHYGTACPKSLMSRL